MGLPKQFYRVNFGQGLDTKSDPKILSSGQMTLLQNSTFTNTNRVSKRNGFSAIGVTDSSGNFISKIDSFQNTIFGIGPSSISSNLPNLSIWSYTESITSPTFLPVAPLYADVTATSFTVAQNNNIMIQNDLACYGNYVIYAWIEYPYSASPNKNAYVKIVDQSTGNVVIPQFKINNALTLTNIRCLAIGSCLAVGSQHVNVSNDTVLQLYSFDTANNFALASATLTSSVSTISVWDWAVSSVTYGLATVAYATSATVLNLATIYSNLSTYNTTSFTAATTIENVGVVTPFPGSSYDRILLVDSSTTIYYIRYIKYLGAPHSITFSATSLGAVNVLTGQEWALNSYAASIFLGVTNGIYSSVTPYVVSETVQGITGSIPGSTLQGVVNTTKPFYVSDNYQYMWCTYVSQSQGQKILYKYSYDGWTVYNSSYTFGSSNLLVPCARILSGNVARRGK